MEQKIIIKGEKDYLEKLEVAFKDYKANPETSAAPKFIIQGEIKANKEGIRAVLTKEIRDRDGEIILISGMKTENFEKNPIMIDAHRVFDPVTQVVLGKWLNPKVEKGEDGSLCYTATPEFADTPNGRIAKTLVDGGFVKTTSIGFGVFDYDFDNKVITESELYEGSLVSVPSNVGAMISKVLGKSVDMGENDLIKKLTNYEEWHPRIKEFRRLILGDELCEMLGYKKIGNELVDLQNIYDIVLIKVKAHDPENQEQKNGEEKKPETQDSKPLEGEAAEAKVREIVATAISAQLEE